MSRILLSLTGWVCMALALLGLALPLLPATPFALAAAACFSRSSTRLHRRLLESKLLGPLVQDWRDSRGLRAATKRSLLQVLIVSAIFSGVVCRCRGQSILCVCLGASIATLVIVLLPTRAGDESLSMAGASSRIS